MKNIKELITKLEENREEHFEMEKKYLEKKLKHLDASRRFEEEEDRLYEKKKELYQSIMQWRDNFVKSENFKNLFYENRFYEADRIKLFVMPKPGHIYLPECEHGHWCVISIDRSGELSYESGYKWCGVDKEFALKNNSGAPRQLTYELLQKFYEFVK